MFLREHHLVADRAEFTLITLIHDGEWQQHVERSVHLPLTSSLLETALRQAGFTQIVRYGNYDETPFDPLTAPALIIVAA